MRVAPFHFLNNYSMIYRNIVSLPAQVLQAKPRTHLPEDSERVQIPRRLHNKGQGYGHNADIGVCNPPS